MHASTDQAARPKVRLRKDRAQEIAAARGVDSLSFAGMAPLFGCSIPNFRRVWIGEILPGEQFIAAALAANPGVTFDDLFEVVS